MFGLELRPEVQHEKDLSCNRSLGRLHHNRTRSGQLDTGAAISFAPVLAVYQSAAVVTVSRWLTSAETVTLRDRFSRPHVHSSGIMGSETYLLVRESDDRVQLIEYLRSIHVYRGAGR